MRGAACLVLILSNLFASPSTLTGQDMSTIRFEAITAAAGIDFTHNSGARGDRYLPETMGPGAGFMDYNSDGWPDVIGGAANGRVRVFLNTASKPAGSQRKQFAAGFDPKLPPIMQPRVLMADLNGDGDEDLFLPSTQGSCLIERSFLEHGYARAKLIAVEKR